jgi:hypothetical protein
VAISVDYDQHLILVTGQDTLSCQELYDFVREIESDEHGITHDQICSGSGKEDLGGGVYVGMTINLFSPWQIKFDAGNYIAKIAGGNLVGGIFGDPIAYSAGVQVLLIQSAASTIVIGDGSSGTGISAGEVAAAVWNAQKGLYGTEGSYGEHLERLVNSSGSLFTESANAATRVVGSDQGGTLTTLNTHDGVNFSTGEVVGAGIDVILEATHSIADTPQACRISGYYQGGGGHFINIQAYDYNLSQWSMRGVMLSRTSPFDYVVSLNDDNIDPLSGKMRIRFLHEPGTYISSHRLHLDYVSWELVDNNASLFSDIASIKNKTDQLLINFGKVTSDAVTVSDAGVLSSLQATQDAAVATKSSVDAAIPDITKGRKMQTNKAIISGDGRTVSIYDDDGYTLLHTFDISPDKLSRVPSGEGA